MKLADKDVNKWKDLWKNESLDALDAEKWYMKTEMIINTIKKLI